MEAPALASFVEEVRSDAAWVGFNVTIPHKRHILSLLDALTPEARAIGAVNTVRREGHRLIGHNTDAAGFEQSLARWWPRLQSRRALLFGTGGAAAAVRFVLDRRNIPYQQVSRHPSGGRTIAYADLTHSLLLSSGWLINATPCGMPGYPALPLPEEGLTALHLVTDLVYRPPLTPLIRAALRASAPAMNGFAMLGAQAREAARFWRLSPPVA